jgi:lipid A 3-O-deacylase
MAFRAALHGLFSLLAFSCCAQAPTARGYVRFAYANDVLTATDRYYTQGVRLEHAGDLWRGSLLAKVLFTLGTDADPLHAFFVQQDCYTPGSIRSTTIRANDRPFAAALYIGQQASSTDLATGLRVNTSIRLGLLGPCAVCAEEQRWIHAALDNIEPLGWEHQVATDVIVNYTAEVERAFWRRRWIGLYGGVKAEVGTWRNALTPAVMIDLGHRPIPNHGRERPLRPRITVFAKGDVQAVAYDAAMQGGVFQRDDPHTLSFDALEHVVPGYEVGARLNYRRIDLRYGERYIGRTFKRGLAHGWGTITIQVWL